MAQPKPSGRLRDTEMPVTPEGWTLLKTCEGCRLSADSNPATMLSPCAASSRRP